jgi:hypothetical protein
MGELVQKNNMSLQDWRKIIKRASLRLFPGHAGYHLPYHKSDRFYRGTDILFTSQDVANPVSLLQHYAKPEMPYMEVKQLYSFARTAHIPPDLGLKRNSSLFSIVPSVDIHLEQAA